MITIRERLADREVILLPVGELDVALAPELREALSSAFDRGTGAVVLDCTRLTFIDATGLGVLVWAANHAQRLRRPFELRNRHAAMEKLLRLTGLDRRFSAPAPKSPLAPLAA